MMNIDFLIDTSLIIDHLRRRAKSSALVRSKLEYGIGGISAVTLVEYQIGELNVGRKPNFSGDFRNILILSLDEHILHRAPYIQAESIALNKKMDFADLLIASTAIYHRLPLLTLNTAHFRHIRDLRLLKVQ